jgi:hypothetical protein
MCRKIYLKFEVTSIKLIQRGFSTLCIVLDLPDVSFATYVKLTKGWFSAHNTSNLIRICKAYPEGSQHVTS